MRIGLLALLALALAACSPPGPDKAKGNEEAVVAAMRAPQSDETHVVGQVTSVEDGGYPQFTIHVQQNGADTPLYLIGAPFQIKVWEALLAIPTGHVTTYGEIAGAIGHPRAVRAVGTAVGRNPISWLIPCHRALRKSGALGGYHWGLPVKRAMLAWEGARYDAALTLA